jgi:hypothetical protein
MRKALLLFIFFIAGNPAVYRAAEQSTVPDTVYTGIYITSIHDIDFRQKEYTVNLWLWLKYKNKDFDFLQNLEVPLAKTVTKSFSTIDTTGSRIYILMKLQCVMKDSWEISHFPFDHQKLKFSIENSQFDSHALIFKEDEGGKHYDPSFTLSGWSIDTFGIYSKVNGYETDFGDDRLVKPQSEYSAYKVDIGIEREALGLFWKMFLGMYVAFLIAFVGFYIHPDSVESRFGLSVGSIFAVVGNKYIIDSALPESSSFTLVDTLHSITLLFIFAVIVSSVYSLNLVKKEEISTAKKFDKIAAISICLTYFILNLYYISAAAGYN